MFHGFFNSLLESTLALLADLFSPVLAKGNMNRADAGEFNSIYFFHNELYKGKFDRFLG
jgi:hypothetical protein